MKALAALIVSASVVSLSHSAYSADALLSAKSVDDVTRVCLANADECEIVVRAYRVYLGPYQCAIKGVPKAIEVPKHATAGKKIKVVWRVKADDSSDTRRYRFAAGSGIRFVNPDPTDGSSFPPDDKDFNDPDYAKEFDAVQPDAINPRRYSWTSVNEHNAERWFHYEINAKWREGPGYAWKPCNPADPKIINKG